MSFLGNPGLAPFSTTIFTEMSALARASGAVNLGQGFPDFDGPEVLRRAAAEAMDAGRNQYAPSSGVAELRNAISTTYERAQGLAYDPVDEITVTSGCTEALAGALLGILRPGDEVVCLEPFYDNYPALTQLVGGVFKGVPLQLRDGRFCVDIGSIRAALTPRTRVLLLNSPHNPTGTVFSREERQALASLAVEQDLIVLSDEVYEHLTFEVDHHTIAALPGMRDRTVVVSSASKTFSVTGWKIGWALAPQPLTDAIRRAHQYLTFCSATPFQYGVAAGLEWAAEDGFFNRFRADYRSRRDQLVAHLKAAHLDPVVPEGTYFVMAQTRQWGNLSDKDFCRWLTTEVGVCAIPPSAFMTDPRHGNGLARFAFCKAPETLDKAGGLLRAAWESGRRPR